MPISSTSLAKSFFRSELRQIMEKQSQHDKCFDQEDGHFNRLEELMMDVMTQPKKMQPDVTGSPT